MIQAETITNAAGQAVTIHTADQQLYAVVLDITWVHTQRGG
jgi:hypothetical protein